VTHGARILVVDDEPQILRSLRTTLASHGYDVQTAATGEEALAAVEGRLPDLVVLDLVLPGLSGRDKVAALDLGADDYLTKPFGVNELLARIRAALRRAAGARGPSAVVEAGGLRVDFDRRQVTLDAAEVRLTPTEFDLLKALVANAGRVLTHGYLLRTVWGPEYEGESQLLRVFIGQLRRKVERDPSRPRQILTEPGVGYRFRLDD
jgi:two-component system KDP operon response regulator KdpE